MAQWMLCWIAKTKVPGSNAINLIFFLVEESQILKHIFAFDFSKVFYFGVAAYWGIAAHDMFSWYDYQSVILVFFPPSACGVGISFLQEATDKKLRPQPTK